MHSLIKRLPQIRTRIRMGGILYSQHSLGGHLAITETSLLRKGGEVPGIKITENNSRYYGLSLLRTPNLGPDMR